MMWFRGIVVFALLVASAPAVVSTNCQLHQVWHYDAQGNLIDVEAFCMNSCGGASTCTMMNAGLVFWCQCIPSNEVAACVAATSTGSYNIRCIESDCSQECVRMEVDWTSENGHQHHQEWCACQ